MCGAVLSFCGRRVLTGSIDATARQWDVRRGGCLHVLAGHGDEVLDVAYDACGRRAASAAADGSVAVHCAATGERLHDFAGHDGEVSRVRTPLPSKERFIGLELHALRLYMLTWNGADLAWLAGPGNAVVDV